jgi:hypothetical protein
MRRETATFVGDFGVGCGCGCGCGVVLVVLISFPTFHFFSFYIALSHSPFLLSQSLLPTPPFTLVSLLSGLCSRLPPSPKLLLRGELR